MIRLDQAFGTGALGGYDDRGMSYPAAPPPPAPPAPPAPPTPSRTVDALGQMLGIPGDVSGSQEFCNMILFVAFGIFALFLLDSLVRLAVRRVG